MAATVEHYLTESDRLSRFPELTAVGKQQSVLMVASTNAERRELNHEVREARIRAGEIEEGRKFAVLLPARQGITVESHQVGDRVVFSGVERGDGRMQKWGARLDTEAEVTGLDRELNLVQVKYSFTTHKKDGREIARTVTRNFSAAEMAGKTTLYQEEQRSFAVGDRIIALKNNSRLDLQNGSLGTIKELDQHGKALVDLDGRETVLDLNRYRKVDHAYAVTIPKGQGATLEYSIMFAPVKPAAKYEMERGPEPLAYAEVPYGKVSYNSLNVAVTRAQFETCVFTNSVEGLARSVEIADGKSSTLRGIPGRQHEVGHGLPGRELPTLDRGRELSEKMNELERAIRGPGKELARAPGLERAGEKLVPGRGNELQKSVPGFEGRRAQGGASLAQRTRFGT